MTTNNELALLFSSSFLSATLLPGSSEALLLKFILNNNIPVSLLIIIASIGNSLGGFSNYIIGLLFPENKKISNNKQITRAQRWGVFILLFSWVPIIGDAFCLAAGYLRFNWLISLLVISIAKLLRYSFIAYMALQI